MKIRAGGEADGGIDIACLPLGAYEPRWFMGTQHMSPEQSLDAHRDLGATHFVGMHSPSAAHAAKPKHSSAATGFRSDWRGCTRRLFEQSALTEPAVELTDF